tara:strand:- start:1805 stop:1951 length:147 start_codon:yes stop_codon:yes gene_type:complete
MFGLKKKMKTYQIRDIDPQTWRMFGAKCKLEGKTIKEKLHELIENSIR